MERRCAATAAVSCVVLLLLVLLAGCSARDALRPLPAAIPPFVATGAPASDVVLPATGEFLAIDEPMREFVRRHLAHIAAPRERLNRLSNLLLESGELGIIYDAELTLGAAQLFRARRGNCLAFSALFVVLAREAGLQASFQDVPVLPNWRLDGSTFVVERHVNVVTSIGGRDFVIDFHPPTAVAYSRARRIPDRNASAQYFGNLGVDRFRAGDLGTAYAILRRGLETDPAAAALWVNLGVILRRNGQLGDAVTAYQSALQLEPDNLSALANLAGVLKALGEDERARLMQARVERSRAGNPYYQYWLGESWLQQGRPETALECFARALRLLPKEADFYFALARSYRALGREQDAARNLAEALEHAPTQSVRDGYRAAFEPAPPVR